MNNDQLKLSPSLAKHLRQMQLKKHPKLCAAFVAFKTLRFGYLILQFAAKSANFVVHAQQHLQFHVEHIYNSQSEKRALYVKFNLETNSLCFARTKHHPFFHPVVQKGYRLCRCEQTRVLQRRKKNKCYYLKSRKKSYLCDFRFYFFILKSINQVFSSAK